MGHGLTRALGAELRAAMKSDPVEGSTERAWLGGLLIIAFLLFCFFICGTGITKLLILLVFNLV